MGDAMVRHEPNKKKRRLKHRQSPDPSPSIRRPTHVVLWDEPPKDNVHEDSEDDQTSHEFAPYARGTRMNEWRLRRLRKVTLSKPLGLAVNGQGRAMEKGGDQPLHDQCE